ncbi:NAD(P)-dependent oxidoreductase [Nocardia gamkensis]|uniref:NAD(P)-dependent oxidoreductase n=1 Tax=Nocardia gamkensis TaxID=352869 RepID=UPI0036EAFF99
MAQVGFVGMGDMGAPMVSRLLERGNDEVTVYGRRDDVVSKFVARGARRATSLEQLAESCDILIACVFSDPQLREVAAGPHGVLEHMRADAVFVSHTTGSPSQLADFAKIAPHVRIVDGAISGAPSDIREGRLTVLLGGDPAPVEAARGVVSAYANPIIATGPAGSAMAVKLLNNVLFAANAQLIASAVQAAQRFGIDARLLLEALTACSGGSTAAAYVLESGGPTEFADQVAKFVSKDIATAAAVAEEVGMDIDFMREVAEQGPLGLGPVDAASAL